MLDLGQLLPNAKRDSKLDTKSDRAVINEAAELKVSFPGSGMPAAVGCLCFIVACPERLQDCHSLHSSKHQTVLPSGHQALNTHDVAASMVPHLRNVPMF